MIALEEGPALEADYGSTLYPPYYPFGPLTDVQVSVPRQQAFPAFFFAQLETTVPDGPWIGMFIFERSTCRDPWRVALNGGLAPAEAGLFEPDLEPDGFLPPDLRGLVMSPRRAPAALARLWQQAKDTGRLPDARPFVAEDVWESDVGESATFHRQGQEHNNGLVGFFKFKAAANRRYAFRGPGSNEIVCTAVYVEKEWRDGYQDERRQNWPHSLPPGFYHQIFSTDVSQPCIWIPMKATNSPAAVRGANAWLIDIYTLDGANASPGSRQTTS